MIIGVYWYRESDNTAGEFLCKTLEEAKQFAKQKIDENCSCVEVLTRGTDGSPFVPIGK